MKNKDLSLLLLFFLQGFIVINVMICNVGLLFAAGDKSILNYKNLSLLLLLLVFYLFFLLSFYYSYYIIIVNAGPVFAAGAALATKLAGG
jgi:hypothetical protein